MKKIDKPKPKIPTYTMVIHRLATEFNLSGTENIFMCTLQSMATANPDGMARVSYKFYSEVCSLHPDSLKDMIKRLMKNDLIRRESKGLYSVNGQFRRSYNKYRFEIQEDNGFKSNMKILKNEREKDELINRKAI